MEIIQTILLLGILGLIVSIRKPRKRQGAPVSSRKIILDTCALIDGRIIELAISGFMSEQLVVPEFILHELQMLADGHDHHKRERARFGLDVVRELQSNSQCTIVIDHTKLADMPTDDKLVALAQQTKADLFTTDYNLQKLAEIKSVRVLNVNELAQNMRPVALPGERKKVKILQKGSNPKQGIGYLEDGTMLVVDNAARYMGKTIETEITRVHQTVAGKMLFAELVRVPSDRRTEVRK